jgi:tripartite-type tricarboxylate transporter receptor subunit TctC
MFSSGAWESAVTNPTPVEATGMPEEFAAFIKAEIKKWPQVICDANIATG